MCGWALLVRAKTMGRASGAGENEIVRAQGVELFFGELLDVQELVLGSTKGADDLVELDVHCLTIAVLRLLNDEDHQERDDRCSGVDDELPCVAESEVRAGHAPQHNQEESGSKGARVSNGPRGCTRELWKNVVALRCHVRVGSGVLCVGMECSFILREMVRDRS
jgi:hypothetical protein